MFSWGPVWIISRKCCFAESFYCRVCRVCRTSSRTWWCFGASWIPVFLRDTCSVWGEWLRWWFPSAAVQWWHCTPQSCSKNTNHDSSEKWRSLPRSPENPPTVWTLRAGAAAAHPTFSAWNVCTQCIAPNWHGGWCTVSTQTPPGTSCTARTWCQWWAWWTCQTLSGWNALPVFAMPAQIPFLRPADATPLSPGCWNRTKSRSHRRRLWADMCFDTWTRSAQSCPTRWCFRFHLHRFQCTRGWGACPKTICFSSIRDRRRPDSTASFRNERRTALTAYVLQLGIAVWMNSNGLVYFLTESHTSSPHSSIWALMLHKYMFSVWDTTGLDASDAVISNNDEESVGMVKLCNRGNSQ